MNIMTLLGTVVAVQANFYLVKIDPEFGEDLSLLCTRRTRLKKIGQKVMVGDRVVIAEPDWHGGRGAIAEVLPRQSELDRPQIANVNQLVLVFALADPPLDEYQLSKFLVKAESTGLEVVLCLNKSDLLTENEQKIWRDRLISWGYNPIFISVVKELGLTEITRKLNHKISVLAGLSGVGKSSLINYLIPETNIRVAEVSGKLSHGRHTTRHVELFALPTGGFIADSPGFNQPDLDCTPEELINYFPEVRDRLKTDSCQFNDCLHKDEPNCTISGDWPRYPYYLEFLEQAIARKEDMKNRPDPESSIKMKSKDKGQSKFEPRLEAKKYRRSSRKTQLQQLQQLYQEDDL
jgi:ribosome biogenesis GTPase / thiamine phosphate phosphatase